MKFAESMLRLYAVTDRSWLGEQTLYEQVELALRGGATCVQLREKELDRDGFCREAKELKTLCARYGVPLIINDNVALAMEVDADGVHVGQEDMDAQDVRSLIGPGKILGVTAKTVEQAQIAQRNGGSRRSNIATLAGTGIRGAAVVSGIFAAADIEEECRVLRAEVEKLVK